jgi:hypothetical protein
MSTKLPWLKAAVWGAVVGVIGTMVIGFTWLGWTLGSTAERVALERANAAVVVALTPACVANFLRQPDATVKLAEFQKTDSWKQRQLVEEGGWATPLGDKAPNSGLANACAEALVKAKT